MMGKHRASIGQGLGKVNPDVEPKNEGQRAAKLLGPNSPLKAKDASEGPRARAFLDQDAERDPEEEKDGEGDLKTNTGADAPATVDPWAGIVRSLKPAERSYLTHIQQFHQELVKHGMRAKALDIKHCRAIIAALAIYPIEDLLLAVQGIQWDDYSKRARRHLEVGFILNPDRIAGWIQKGVDGPPPGHPLSKKALNGADQDGVATYDAVWEVREPAEGVDPKPAPVDFRTRMANRRSMPYLPGLEPASSKRGGST